MKYKDCITIKMEPEMIADIESVAARRGISAADAGRELMRAGLLNVQQIVLFDQRQGHKLTPPLSKEEQYQELCMQLARLQIFTDAIKRDAEAILAGED